MARIIPEIPVKFEGKFPDDFDNRIQNWGFFTRDEIEENAGRLLMLDIDFGRYCSLSCPGCFRKDSALDGTNGEESDGEMGVSLPVIDRSGRDMPYDNLLKVIDEARELGLRSVKICGAGEPTENVRFLQFVRDMTNRNVGVATFTKGQVLGSDEQTERFYGGRYGIHSAQQLCEKFYGLNVSFMLGFQSFDTDVQDRMVGGVEGHTLVRNNALVNLVNAGFNEPNPTRLAVCSNPITQENHNEVFDIYVWARQRNLYPVTAVLMTSGKQIDEEFLRRNDISDEEKVDLWERIYSWNIDRGVQTLEQIREEGISVLPGMHPCNQVACGLYVTARGVVVGCPGYGERGDIEGDVTRTSLGEIWENSVNRGGAGVFNCHCPPKDGHTVPDGLYEEVLSRLEVKYG